MIVCLVWSQASNFGGLGLRLLLGLGVAWKASNQTHVSEQIVAVVKSENDACGTIKPYSSVGV